MLVFYFSPGSSSMAVHIGLHEVGARFESHALSFARKEHRAKEFLAINPEGKVPTLLIEGRRLTEVAAILYYLARVHPEAALLPQGDPEAEAQVISWHSFIASTLHPARVRGLDYARQVWALAEQRLGDREWAIGRYSIADIHLFRLYWRFATSLDLAPSDFPRLTAHRERMLARPAVQQTIELESAIGYELPA